MDDFNSKSKIAILSRVASIHSINTVKSIPEIGSYDTNMTVMDACTQGIFKILGTNKLIGQ